MARTKSVLPRNPSSIPDISCDKLSKGLQYFLGSIFVGIEEIMNPTSAFVLTAEFQPAARNPVGRIHVRHAGHERRARRLPVFRMPADALAARDRRRRSGLALLPRRASNGVARPFLSSFHRIFCRHRPPYGEPLDSFPSSARHNLRCFLWRGCLLLHESRRGLPFGRHTVSVLFSAVGYRRRHTHLLCWIAHRPSSTTVLGNTGSNTVGDANLINHLQIPPNFVPPLMSDKPGCLFFSSRKPSETRRAEL